MMRYLKRALQDIRQNRFLSLVTIVTIALSILIVSAFALFFLNANDLINAWKKGVHIMVYLKNGVVETEVSRLQKMLQGMVGIEEVDFISRDEALKQLKEQLPHQSFLLDNLKQNPLPDAFEVHLLPATRNWAKIEKLAVQLEKLPEVEEVEYGRGWLGRFAAVFNLFRLAGYARGLCSFWPPSSLSPIRSVSCFIRREEVEIMRLVGAEDRFYQTPFSSKACSRAPWAASSAWRCVYFFSWPFFKRHRGVLRQCFSDPFSADRDACRNSFDEHVGGLAGMLCVSKTIF